MAQLREEINNLDGIYAMPIIIIITLIFLVLFLRMLVDMSAKLVDMSAKIQAVEKLLEKIMTF